MGGCAHHTIRTLHTSHFTLHTTHQWEPAVRLLRDMQARVDDDVRARVNKSSGVDGDGGVMADGDEGGRDRDGDGDGGGDGDGDGGDGDGDGDAALDVKCYTVCIQACGRAGQVGGWVARWVG